MEKNIWVFNCVEKYMDICVEKNIWIFEWKKIYG